MLAGGPAVPSAAVTAGQIAKITGLADVQIGDTVGRGRTPTPQRHFAPPTLETVVVPARPSDTGALHAALAQLAEQDPLINLRQDDIRHELTVSLYGEVQKEVIEATLADEFDLHVGFRETTTICVERLVGTGAAAEFMGAAATRSAPPSAFAWSQARPASGMQFRLEVELGSMPSAFIKAVEETARETPRAGPARLAGPRLHRDDDALRIRAAAAVWLEQVVKLGRRLPQPDAAGADDRAPAGQDDRVRADQQLPPRGPGRLPTRRADGPRPAARYPADTGRAPARPASSRARFRPARCTTCSSSCRR